MTINDFPTIAIKPVMTDDDCQFHSDMDYMHDLLEVAMIALAAIPVDATKDELFGWAEEL